MFGAATRPAVPAAASLRNLRRPTGLSASFAIGRVSRLILANRRVAVKVGSTRGLNPWAQPVGSTRGLNPWAQPVPRVTRRPSLTVAGAGE